MRVAVAANHEPLLVQWLTPGSDFLIVFISNTWTSLLESAKKLDIVAEND